jgi:hypothetical protein
MTDTQLPTKITPGERLLTAEEFYRLKDVPPETEWFAVRLAMANGAGVDPIGPIRQPTSRLRSRVLSPRRVSGICCAPTA